MNNISSMCPSKNIFVGSFCGAFFKKRPASYRIPRVLASLKNKLQRTESGIDAQENNSLHS